MTRIRGFWAGAIDWETCQLLTAAGAKWPVGRSRLGGLCLSGTNGLTGRSKAQGAKEQRRKKKSKDHRLPSESDSDVIPRLAGSRKSKLDLSFTEAHRHGIEWAHWEDDGP